MKRPPDLNALSAVPPIRWRSFIFRSFFYTGLCVLFVVLRTRVLSRGKDR